MLIGINGKIGSGKDTVGKIIQYLVQNKDFQNKVPKDISTYDKFNNLSDIDKQRYSDFIIRKYADKLKDFICMLIGCTREQLEDQEFKNTVLPEEWWYWKFASNSKPYTGNENFFKDKYLIKEHLIKTTPRLLLQIIGTECIRDKVHPNAWVNALFADYKPKMTYDVKSEEAKKISDGKYIVPRLPNIPIKYWDKLIETRRFTWHENIINDVYPNWIITDMRFPNELEAVKSRGGITIRVNRFEQISTNIRVHGTGVPHESETALDNAEFDYTIENNSTIEDLIQTVSLILTKEKII